MPCPRRNAGSRLRYGSDPARPPPLTPALSSDPASPPSPRPSARTAHRPAATSRPTAPAGTGPAPPRPPALAPHTPYWIPRPPSFLRKIICLTPEDAAAAPHLSRRRAAATHEPPVTSPQARTARYKPQCPTQVKTQALSCCKNLPAGRNVVPALLLERQLRGDVAVKSQGLRQQRDDVVVTGPPGPPGVTSRPRRHASSRETASQPLPAGLPGHQDTAGTLKFLELRPSSSTGTTLSLKQPANDNAGTS